MAKVLILMGLPGSGKTTFAEQYVNERNSSWKEEAYHINVDKIKENGFLSDTEEILRKCFRENIKDNIIDGLFLCTEDVIHVIDCLPYKRNNIEIHYWEPDIEKCLYNDADRRQEKSENTILNCNLEYPDIELIKKRTGADNVTVINHDVVRKPFWKVKTDGLGLYLKDGRYIYSDRWGLGGECCDCWGGTYHVLPEERHVYFPDLCSLLESVCPKTTFQNYKILFNECVDICQEVENDYYGGSMIYAFYRCDVKKLFNLLEDLGLI